MFCYEIRTKACRASKKIKICSSSWGPAQRTAAKQMDVEMEYRLSRARAYIEHGAISVLDLALARNVGRREVTPANHVGALSLRLFQARKMSLSVNHHMA